MKYQKTQVEDRHIDTSKKKQLHDHPSPRRSETSRVIFSGNPLDCGKTASTK